MSAPATRVTGRSLVNPLRRWGMIGILNILFVAVARGQSLMRNFMLPQIDRIILAATFSLRSGAPTATLLFWETI